MRQADSVSPIEKQQPQHSEQKTPRPTCSALRIAARSSVGNSLVYLDQNYMTLGYARLLAPAIGALADRALAHG